MASPRSPFLFVLIPISLLLIFGSCYSLEDSLKVNLTIYHDTVCESCSVFIVQKLAKVFDNHLNAILNVRLNFWSSSYIDKNIDILCQYDPDKCNLNAVEACAANVSSDGNSQFGFIHCIEDLLLRGRQNEWKKCSNMLGLPDGQLLIDCYDNKNVTNELQVKYTNAIMELNPPPKFLPWVVVNNEPLDDDYEKFQGYVCKAYQGNPKPKACSSAQNGMYENVAILHLLILCVIFHIY